MRIQTMLQTTAVLGLAVVAGLLVVGGTWALWNVAAPAQAGTVQSATFDVKINKDSASTSRSVQVASPSEELAPDAPVYSSFTLTNDNDASSDFRINAEFGTPRVHSENPELDRLLNVSVAPQPVSGGCAGADYTRPPSTTLDKNAAATVCVRYSLSKSAPSSVSGSQATVTIQVTATQIQPTTSK